MTNAPELEITGRTAGRVARAPGFGSHGEPVRCVRAKSGRIIELQIAGTKFFSADRVAREIAARYDKPKAKRRRKTRRARTT
jgi:D-alanyl-D-alanine carboxypeptidase